MIVKSHSERLNELLGLLDLAPDLEQIGSFLSKSSDPYGEICGISVMRLESSGFIKDEFLIGFKEKSRRELKLNISDDYPVAVALRTNTLQLADLTIGGAEYRDLPQVERLEDYRSGIILPVSDSLLFGLALTSSVEEIRKHLDYFEVVRKLLSQYLIRKKI